jgi:hypothetical protein
MGFPSSVNTPPTSLSGSGSKSHSSSSATPNSLLMDAAGTRAAKKFNIESMLHLHQQQQQQQQEQMQKQQQQQQLKRSTSSSSLKLTPPPSQQRSAPAEEEQDTPMDLSVRSSSVAIKDENLSEHSGCAGSYHRLYHGDSDYDSNESDTLNAADIDDIDDDDSDHQAGGADGGSDMERKPFIPLDLTRK